jgi:hypothetical protein
MNSLESELLPLPKPVMLAVKRPRISAMRGMAAPVARAATTHSIWMVRSSGVLNWRTRWMT